MVDSVLTGFLLSYDIILGWKRQDRKNLSVVKLQQIVMLLCRCKKQSSYCSINQPTSALKQYNKLQIIKCNL